MKADGRDMLYERFQSVFDEEALGLCVNLTRNGFGIDFLIVGLKVAHYSVDR